jgi:hypothetical protein
MAYIPNIPGVSTSVLDRSEIDTPINGNRTVLIPGFFRYGKEGFKLVKGGKLFKHLYGNKNIKKYGKAYMYADAAATTNQALIYRLVANDATYANNSIDLLGNQNAFVNIASKDQLFDADPDMILGALARYKGEGYNNIFVTFKAATSYEKADANANGETNYKFNFIEANVYEELGSTGGIKALGDPVVFSLSSYNEENEEPVIDQMNGSSLFINDVFKDSNEFMTLMVNEDKIEDIHQYPNIDSLVTNGRFIVSDVDNENIKYEIKVENVDKTITDANGVNQIITEPTLVAKVTSLNPSPTFRPVINYIDADGNAKSSEVSVSSGTINLSNGDSADGEASYYIDGESSYYVLTIDVNGDLVFDVKSTVRGTLYNALIETPGILLNNGSDGKNIYLPNGSLNMTSFSNDGQNALECILDFYNNHLDLQDVLYPKYDFDYIPDWTQNISVCKAIIGLADRIGLSMPLISLPTNYNFKVKTTGLVDEDLEMRRNNIINSSYNSMLYSAQINKTHRDEKNLKMYMPASYYAMLAHLSVDNAYSITEPVANIVKGRIDANSINLTYEPTSLDIEKLRNEQINAILVEPDGNYFIDQLTMYKKSSKLSRGNLVKVLHRIRKDLPKLLKDLIQSKSTSNITEKSTKRVEKELSKWKVSSDNEKDGIFETIKIDAYFNEKLYKLRLTVTVNAIGTLENIDIPIIVV